MLPRTTLLLPFLLTALMGCTDDDSMDGDGSGASGSGASGTGANGTGASGTGATSTGGDGTGGDGGAGSGADCTSNADCISGKECFGPNEPQVCGIAPQEGCASDDDCVPNGICHAIFDGCSLDGVGSECRDACMGDSCGSGMVCILAGACEVELCSGPDDCPAHQTCDPSAIPGDAPVHARHDGCVNILCSDANPCSGGLVCVNGYCQEGIGGCAEPMLAP